MAWTIDDLETPAVLVDLDRVEANLARAQSYADAQRLALRPHIKTHKIPEFARRQMELAGVPAIVLAGVQQRFEHTLAQQQARPYAGQTTADALAWLGAPARP